jgi:hypothetical protein
MKEQFKKLFEYKPLNLPRIKALDLRRPVEKSDIKHTSTSTIVYQRKG